MVYKRETSPEAVSTLEMQQTAKAGKLWAAKQPDGQFAVGVKWTDAATYMLITKEEFEWWLKENLARLQG